MSKKTEALSKADFWEPLKSLYPQAYEKFGTWINEYKKDNNWNDLFHAYDDVDSLYAYEAPKFHDLPMFMQVGIFFQFIADEAGEIDDCVKQMKTLIIDFLKLVEGELS